MIDRSEYALAKVEIATPRHRGVFLLSGQLKHPLSNYSVFTLNIYQPDNVDDNEEREHSEEPSLADELADLANEDGDSDTEGKLDEVESALR